MRLTAAFLLAWIAIHVVAPSASASVPTLPVVAQDGVLGRWSLRYLQPGKVEPSIVRMVIEAGVESTVTATIWISGRPAVFEGTFDAASGELKLTGSLGPRTATVAVTLRDGKLVGDINLPGRHLSVTGWRVSETEAAAEQPVVFPPERPTQVSLAGLPESVAVAASALIEQRMDERRVVGLSAAFVLEGELADVRSFGWEDFHGELPATSATRYRWASISKTLTAVLALQLAERGELNLDADVRELVPEYDKGAVVTCRQLLCHQAGVTHYGDMLVRTMKEYDVPHPWADRILALDMFVETDLLSEPGTEYSYSTPGYVVLGAAIQRAQDGTYAEQVKRGICAPLGMRSMRPDYQWEEIPHRTRGYQRFENVVLDAGDDDISWKLPAGGWISTVEDLARFGAGLMGSQLMKIESQLAMWEPQRTTDGQLTTYGLGVNVSRVQDEFLVIAHSGGQLKTSTFLMCCPDLGLAVALMCNTEGTQLSDLAGELLGMLIADQQK